MIAAALAWCSPLAFAQTGACCDYYTGSCQSNVPRFYCGAESNWFQGLTCAQVSPPCAAWFGACCDRRTGACDDFLITQAECAEPYNVWAQGARCYAAPCDTFRVIHVDPNAPGPVHDGTSWSSAHLTLGGALASALSGDTIHVADGVFKPGTVGLQDPRDATFRLRAYVNLLGGFAGFGGNDPDKRDLSLTPSILSGDLDGDDGPDFQNYSNNCKHVVTAIDLPPGTTLDGFEVVGGNAKGLLDGGGLRCVGGALRVARCTFRRNLSSAIWGGGIAVQAAALDLSNCLLVGNVADIGSAMCIRGPSKVQIAGTTIVGNGFAGCGPTGAISVLDGAEVHVQSSILWNNLGCPPSEEAQVLAAPDTILSISYSCVEGYTGKIEGDWNFNEDPLFVSAKGADGIYGTPDDDLRLTRNSTFINAGNPTAVLDAADSDLDGHSRILCGRIDSGAYEFGIGDHDCDHDVTLDDGSAWAGCASDPRRSDGPQREPYVPGCEAFDFNADADVDLQDFSVFATMFTGKR